MVALFGEKTSTGDPLLNIGNVYFDKNIKNIDYCYATSTPLTVGITALLLKKINKISRVKSSRDCDIIPIKYAALRQSPNYREDILLTERKSTVSSEVIRSSR